MGIIQYPKDSFVIPSHVQKGLDNQADADPVIAKTIKIIMNWKFVSIPQRCLSLFILYFYLLTKILTLSNGNKTIELLFVSVLKKNHVIIN